MIHMIPYPICPSESTYHSFQPLFLIKLHTLQDGIRIFRPESCDDFALQMVRATRQHSPYLPSLALSLLRCNLKLTRDEILLWENIGQNCQCWSFLEFGTRLFQVDRNVCPLGMWTPLKIFGPKGGLWGMAVGNHTHWTIMNSDSIFSVFSNYFSYYHIGLNMWKKKFRNHNFCSPQRPFGPCGFDQWNSQRPNLPAQLVPRSTCHEVSDNRMALLLEQSGTQREDMQPDQGEIDCHWCVPKSTDNHFLHCRYYKYYTYIIYAWYYDHSIVIVIPCFSIVQFKRLRQFDDWKALRGGFQSCASADAAFRESWFKLKCVVTRYFWTSGNIHFFHVLWSYKFLCYSLVVPSDRATSHSPVSVQRYSSYWLSGRNGFL